MCACCRRAYVWPWDHNCQLWLTMAGPFQVGLIKKAWRHPDAESLYIEEIDVGEEQPRQVGAGPCCW